MWVIVSVAAPVNDGVGVTAIDPDDAAPNVTSVRVLVVATAVVPALPGSAVCNSM
jgi:hypothetical protein